MQYIKDYLSNVSKIAESFDPSQIKRIIDELNIIRKNKGRLFFLGIGGGATNASHAVNDFRKICGFEAYTPMDNIAEFSARINDEGWDTVFVYWLKDSRLNDKDGVFIFSVGGGDKEKNVSPNLVEALLFAREVGAKVFGVVGRKGGYTAKVADACITIPPLNKDTVTPHTESFQSIVWHLIVSHPDMKRAEMKWESIQ